MSMGFLGLNIGLEQIAVIIVVALILVGPDKLPYYARKAAKVMRNIRRVTSNITNELSKSIGLDEETGSIADIKKDLTDIKASVEKDISDLKSSFSNQAKAVTDVVEKSAKDTTDTIRKSAQDISTPFQKPRSTASQQAPEETAQRDDMGQPSEQEHSHSSVSSSASSIEAPKSAPLTPHIFEKKESVPPPSTQSTETAQ